MQMQCQRENENENENIKFRCKSQLVEDESVKKNIGTIN